MTKLLLVRFYRTSSRVHMLVTPFLNEVIMGLMLGDLHVEKPSVRHNARLQFKQSTINALYIAHLYSLLESFCSSPPIWLSYFDGRLNKLKTYTSLKLQTVSIPCFNIYRDSFYNNLGVKFVPANISDSFTAVSLAYWFMDDGYKGVTGYYFCTESFSSSDLVILIDMLTNKFGLDCSLHKTTNGPRIYIKRVSCLNFANLVKPHMIPHFYYKLH